MADPPAKTSTDLMWCTEVASMLRFCAGRGLDPGAGGRTVSPDVVCHDIAADGVSAMALPYQDGEFDYVFTCHLIEHMQDTSATIREWLRVVRSGGHVIMIVPNTLYTKGQNTDATPHYHEWAPREFIEEICGEPCLKPWIDAIGMSVGGATIVHAGDAMPRWSFGVVLRKD